MPSPQQQVETAGRYMIWICLHEGCEWGSCLPLDAAPPSERPYCPAALLNDLHKLTVVDMIPALAAERLAEALREYIQAATAADFDLDPRLRSADEKACSVLLDYNRAYEGTG